MWRERGEGQCKCGEREGRGSVSVERGEGQCKCGERERRGSISVQI